MSDIFARRAPVRARVSILLPILWIFSGASSSPLHAQSGQKYGAQLAVLTTSIGIGPTASATGGFGLEPQLRLNSLFSNERLGTLSVGVGGQWTRHSGDDQQLTITGVFLEPRWVLITPSTRFFPYLSARLALLNQSSNFGTSSGGAAFGGGAGLAWKLSQTANLDFGAALVRQTFGDFAFTSGSEAVGEFEPFLTYAIKVGISIGFPR